jgi:uncharacterized protein DUF3604
MNLYFGDMHTQFEPGADESQQEWEIRLRTALESARDYLDFLPIVFYPAFFSRLSGGLRTESVGMRPEFTDRWEVVKRIVSEHHDPGRFVTFPGYEWTGNRSQWGDHNVFFNEDDPPLDLSLHVDELFANLKARGALAIPHHTGYRVGNRGKNWDHHDEAVSPFMEVFSGHGSSEGCGTPYTMYNNGHMSPRTAGGTLTDGLKRGHRLGIIASGDNAGGFGGIWGQGLAAVWADELTRDGLWDAFRKRRVYGVTGDRIQLEYRLNDGFMGDVVPAESSARITVDVSCTRALDRVEIIRDGRVAYTHCHNGSWDTPTSGVVRAKIPVAVGWGPTLANGFDVGDHMWEGSLRLSGGRVIGTEGCFTTHGQRIKQSDDDVAFTLRTLDRGEHGRSRTSMQTIVFEVEAPVDAPITLEVNGLRDEFTLAEAMDHGHLLVFDDVSRRMVQEHFDIDPDTIQNRDMFYHNAWIVKRHVATPQVGTVAHVEWEDTQLGDWYYVRVSQTNGQMAWSSPITFRVAKGDQ